MSGLCVASAAAAQPTPELVLHGYTPDSRFNVPRAVVLNSARGEILVGDTGNHSVDVFSLFGRPLARYVHRVERHDGTWVDGNPVGLAVDSVGRILVVDAAASYVDVLDGLGRSFARLEPPASADSGTAGPGAVTVLKSGVILVGMSGDTGRIYRFTREYALDGSWGEAGRSPGQLSSVIGLAEEADGRILVVCPDTELAVQRFTADGKFVEGFGRHEIGPGNFSFPSGITITSDGSLYVSDELRHVVVVLDSTGKQVDAIGGGGPGPGQFEYPSALSSDNQGRLAVVERGTARLQLLRLAGKNPE
ncbi:MAG TPA: NHL repeat-containing protein [Candidatus Eisenbacteria bacterium]|nr:NHL repeat-containing protein [Candidatus Eisenbacteria bacterium]